MEHAEGKRISKRMKTVLACVATLIAVICFVVIVSQLIGGTKAENNSIIVYRTAGEIYVRIGDKERTVSDLSADEFKCDEEKERVFFTVESSQEDGLYDLYFIQKHRSEILEPKIIDVGVEKNFDLVSGKVYYLKKNKDAGAYDGCVCDIDSSKIETFSVNVDGVFALKGAEKLYFTKMHGTNKVLYSYKDGTPEEICRDIVNIFCYNSAEKPHIIFERKSQINTGMTELFVAYTEGEPEMICDNTYTVMFDDYSAGGNLYYFTSGTESISWTAVISDEYAESDKTVTKPKRDNFFAILGISSEYNEAFREYQDKLVRDEIRAALNESVKNGDFSAPVFTAFAYNSQGTFKIAEKIDPRNVCSVSDFGVPKIIYENTQIVSNQTDMATLVSIAQRSTMSEVIEYARSVVDGSVKSLGLAFAACGENGAVCYELKGYDNRKTLFDFSENGSRIYAFVRDLQGERLSLYTNSLNDSLMPSASFNVDNGLSSYHMLNDTVIYLKADLGKNTGDLYSYDGESSVKLSNAANAFTVENTDDVIILKGHDLSGTHPTADYYICTEDEEQLIGSDIIVSSFAYTENGKAAYICGEENGNLLVVYSKGRSAVVAENVDEIILFE